MSVSLPAAIRTAALSPHQTETIRNMRDHPDCATRYDLVYLCALSGPVALDCLERAIGDLVRRHAALRTTVGATTQQVHPEPFPALTHAPPEPSVAAVVHRLERERYGLAEVLAGQPLFRARLHRVDGEPPLLSLCVHHLVYDGWSLSVIWRDLAELYRARSRGEPARLPVLHTTYADRAEAWQRERPGLTAAATAYWRAAAAGCARSVPWRPPDPAVRPDTGVESAVFGLTTTVLTGIRRLARECRVSPFTVMLAVTGAALAEVTGLPRVLLGNDDAAREDELVHDVVGLFVDTRLTPVTVGEGRPVAELVRSIAAGWRQGYRDPAHVDRILDAIGRPELVKVGLSTPARDGGLALPGAGVTPVPVPWNTRYWRNLTVTWAPGEKPTLRIGFRPSTVHRETPEALAGAIIRVGTEQVMRGSAQLASGK